MNIDNKVLAAKLARDLIALGGEKCYRIEFKLGCHGDETPSGGMNEAALVRFFTGLLNMYEGE